MKTRFNTNKLTEEKEAFALVIKAKSLNLPVDVDRTSFKMTTLLNLMKKMIDSNNRVHPIEYYPIRQEVELLHDLLKKDEDFLNSFHKDNTALFCSKLKSQVKRSKLHRTLEIDYGVDESCYEKTLNDVLKEVFKVNKEGVIITIGNDERTITQELMDDYLNVKQIRKDLIDFNSVYNATKSKTHLPIFFRTAKYIKFDKGLSLISFRLDSSNGKRMNLTDTLIREFINVLTKDGLELSNLSFGKSNAIVTVLVENEEVDRVLDLFGEAYETLYGYTYKNDYNLDLTVTYDIGQKEQRTEWYYVLNGKEFDVLRDRCESINRKFLGLDLYN